LDNTLSNLLEQAAQVMPSISSSINSLEEL
jgi:hypothetical protein